MMMQVLKDWRYMDVDTHWEIARVAKLILDKDFRAKNTPGDNTPFIISSIYKPNNTTSTVSPNKWMEQEDKENLKCTTLLTSLTENTHPTQVRMEYYPQRSHSSTLKEISKFI